MASRRRNLFYQNKKQETTEIGPEEWDKVGIEKQLVGPAYCSSPLVSTGEGSVEFRSLLFGSLVIVHVLYAKCVMSDALVTAPRAVGPVKKPRASPRKKSSEAPNGGAREDDDRKFVSVVDVNGESGDSPRKWTTDEDEADGDDEAEDDQDRHRVTVIRLNQHDNGAAAPASSDTFSEPEADYIVDFLDKGTDRVCTF
ncbi:hypothetical protein AAG570_009840 [Ranatra chinensis]|uniref:Uncharacterized protein n=1 Tax=Ranatra chinensis TaxID=642074 RepID=A0ABD0Z7C3_9HEMI